MIVVNIDQADKLHRDLMDIYHLIGISRHNLRNLE